MRFQLGDRVRNIHSGREGIVRKQGSLMSVDAGGELNAIWSEEEVTLVHHAGVPPVDDWPAPPEHVRTTEPNKFETEVGVIWCRRCGRSIWSKKHGDIDAPPCRVVAVKPR
jgi:hypothetical protein